jgi:hypothetical protein
MNMDNMAIWLSGSVLFTLGIVVIVTGIILINNMIHKFWKPITIVIVRNDGAYPKLRYSSEREMSGIKEPHLFEDELKPKNDVKKG